MIILIKNGEHIKTYKKIRKVIINVLSILLVFFYGIKYLQNNYGYNVTKSLPKGIYKLYEPTDIKKGDIIVFDIDSEKKELMVNRNYINDPKIKLIKKVTATSGDVIRIDKKLEINDVSNRYVIEKDSYGRQLPVWYGTHILKDDEYFVEGTDLFSYDSLYFGAIKKNQIQKKAKLVWSF